MSASFLELSVLMEESPKDIKATIRKNNPTVMTTAMVALAANLFIAKSFAKGANADSINCEPFDFGRVKSAPELILLT